MKRSGPPTAVVNGVLGKVLGATGPDSSGGTPTLLVFNKIDLAGAEEAARLARTHPGSVGVSAATGEGIVDLLEAIGSRVAEGSILARVEVAAADGRAISLVEETGRVLERAVSDEMIVFTVMLSRRDAGRLESAARVTILSGGGEAG